MSFGDMGAGHPSRQGQPRQRRDAEDSAFECNIRKSIQDLQRLVREAVDLVDRLHKNQPTKRSTEKIQALLEESRAYAVSTEQLFRDWTVQLTGEPAERHRKKFSYDKLRKALEDEVANLKEAGRRATAFQQGDVKAGTPQPLQAICEQSDEEQGLLGDSVAEDNDEQAALQENRLAEERQEGIRRIQNQVSEVNQIFRDLASIVTEQGQQFSTIEEQTEDAAANTAKGVTEIQKSVDNSRTTRDRLCCMLLTVILLLCFVLLPHINLGTNPKQPVVANLTMSNASDRLSGNHSGGIYAKSGAPAERTIVTARSDLSPMHSAHKSSKAEVPAIGKPNSSSGDLSRNQSGENDPEDGLINGSGKRSPHARAGEV